VAWVGLKLGIRPIHITLANLGLAIICCTVMAAGEPNSRWIAAVIIVTWQLLDTVDGTIARAISERSNYGGFVDQLAGMVLIAFLPISIGVGLYLHPEGSLEEVSNRLGLGITYLPTYSLIAGALGSISALLMRLVQRTIMLRFQLNLVKTEQSMPGGLGGVANAVKQLENLGGALIIILIASVALGVLEWYLVYYALLSCGMLAGSIVIALISLRHHHAYPDKTGAD